MHNKSGSASLHTIQDAPRETIAEYQQEYAEPGMGEAQTVSITCSPRMRLFAIAINLMVLTELCIAMYFAAQDQTQLTPVFFKVFFSLLLPTLVIAFVGRRIIAKADQ